IGIRSLFPVPNVVTVTRRRPCQIHPEAQILHALVGNADRIFEALQLRHLVQGPEDREIYNVEQADRPE
ncbi:MAG: hypothetical protein VCD66_15820, partial [Alphaproteobacteria bacterium]